MAVREKAERGAREEARRAGFEVGTSVRVILRKATAASTGIFGGKVVSITAAPSGVDKGAQAPERVDHVVRDGEYVERRRGDGQVIERKRGAREAQVVVGVGVG